MALHLGAILGGPELEQMAFRTIVRTFAIAKDACQDELVSAADGELDVVHQYPGTLFQPEFKGIRTGSFSRKQKMLQIQVEVPSKVIGSEKFGEFYLDSLEKVVRLGKQYFDKKGIPFSLETHLALVQHLRTALQDYYSNSSH
jgi:hypothetical protein